MNILAELKSRFHAALVKLLNNQPGGNLAELVEMVRPSQDAKFGDYQANFAMSLGKQLGRPPRDVATEVVSHLQIDDLCEPAEVAGPGFINLRLRGDWLVEQIESARRDSRLGVAAVENPRTFIVDYSAPNVAKPMHVGHIRSTVIGDALYHTLQFLGHTVVGDNHLGDWGTQFGMIIYGYKHFLDADAFAADQVGELARLYRLVRKLVDYQDGRRELPELEAKLLKQQAALDEHVREIKAINAKTPDAKADAKHAKQAEKTTRQLEKSVANVREEIESLRAKLAAVESDPTSAALAKQHAGISTASLQETAKLHSGDAENVRLWQSFLPACSADIERIYRRLGVTFDETLGESFYHDRLGAVVADLQAKGLARESQGALAVFLPDQEVPMLVRKQDGAFLYATTDLATIQYRIERWQPDAILYVVDHRQGLHFEQLFAVARLWASAAGESQKPIELQHVSFGTVLGDDGRPFKTRSGDTVGLWGLLDEAVDRARAIVSGNDDGKPNGPELSADERQRVAEAIGIGAIKYADLSQNRTSDYTFSYDKMLAMQGNTATYMQYSYARISGIFARGEQLLHGENNSDSGAMPTALSGHAEHDTQHDLRSPGAMPTALSGHAVSQGQITLDHPAERALAVAVLRFSEALQLVVSDYRPNHLTNYLYELSNAFSTFYENCSVLKAETHELRRSRLLLCDVTARVIQRGLELLGIEVVQKM